MEFTLDLALIRDVLKRETGQSRRDIEELGLLEALGRAGRRHDAALAEAADAATLACAVGCSWCCHFTVDVRAVEAFRILEFVKTRLSQEQAQAIYDQVRCNSAAIKRLSDDERAARNEKCPFLVQGCCAIYEARPQSCRNYHATDATGCQRSYQEPENLDIDPDFAPATYQIGGAHVEAFSGAMNEAGFDDRVYELNCALEAALSDPQAQERFLNGLTPFIDLVGDDVPMEFADLRPSGDGVNKVG